VNNWINTESYFRHEKRVRGYGLLFALSMLFINGGGFAARWFDGAVGAMVIGIVLFLLFITSCAIEPLIVFFALRRQ